MLKNLGFKPGDTMGKSGGGISQPIIPERRPDHLGLAYGGYKEKKTHEGKSLMEDIQQPEPKPEKKREQKWKVDAKKAQEQRKVRMERLQTKKEYTQYKKELEIQHLNKTLIGKRNMKIIDMTGPSVCLRLHGEVGSDRDRRARPGKGGEA